MGISGAGMSRSADAAFVAPAVMGAESEAARFVLPDPLLGDDATDDRGPFADAPDPTICVPEVGQ